MSKEVEERLDGLFTTLTELMARSENRIADTNKMISNLGEDRHWISEQYVKHLDRLEKKLSKMVDVHAEMLMGLREEQRRNAMLEEENKRLLRVIERLAEGKPGQQVNVNT